LFDTLRLPLAIVRHIITLVYHYALMKPQYWLLVVVTATSLRHCQIGHVIERLKSVRYYVVE